MPESARPVKISLDEIGTIAEHAVSFGGKVVTKPTFYEFFAGGGMARAGLGDDWRCLFANDFDAKKVESYKANWGDREIRLGDIHKLTAGDLPGHADLAWASFPCQDLSLAGLGRGLVGERSGSFWGFERAIRLLKAEGRAPRLIVLENVVGMLSVNDGRDFATICSALDDLGYRFGALVIDAIRFLPHSRPRLFVVAQRRDQPLDPEMAGLSPEPSWSTAALERAFDRLPEKLRREWVWWALPPAPAHNAAFADLIEEEPDSVIWRSDAQTRELLAMMSPVNRQKVEAASGSGRRMVGAIYKRTRFDAAGAKVQRAEVRFDDVAGCLRTPAGGSSRQLILVVDGKRIRSRLISSRETARLMGLPEDYRLPERYNDAYHLTGDGVAVPVVRHLAEYLFALVPGPGEEILVAAE